MQIDAAYAQNKKTVKTLNINCRNENKSIYCIHYKLYIYFFEYLHASVFILDTFTPKLDGLISQLIEIQHKNPETICDIRTYTRFVVEEMEMFNLCNL